MEAFSFDEVKTHRCGNVYGIIIGNQPGPSEDAHLTKIINLSGGKYGKKVILNATIIDETGSDRYVGNVFIKDEFKDKGTYVHPDQFPDGLKMVMVNGQVVGIIISLRGVRLK